MIIEDISTEEDRENRIIRIDIQAETVEENLLLQGDRKSTDAIEINIALQNNKE